MLKKLLFLWLFLFFAGTAAAEGIQKWYPFMDVQPRTMQQYAHDIVSGHSRVSGNELLARLRLQGLDYPTAEAFAHALLTDPNFSERICMWKRSELPTGFGIERTDVTGTQFSTWDRDDRPLCREDEMVIYYKDRPIILPWCGNVIQWPTLKPVAVATPRPARQTVVIHNDCQISFGNSVSGYWGPGVGYDYSIPCSSTVTQTIEQ